MTTAVITAPVPPPTIAPMPTIANAGTLRGGINPVLFSAAANAPPSVAPMNSEGEKMPPDDPEPRLKDVATSFETNSSARNQATPWPPVRIDCTVAYPTQSTKY